MKLVLFLHGYLSNPRKSFAKFVPLLKKDRSIDNTEIEIHSPIKIKTGSFKPALGIEDLAEGLRTRIDNIFTNHSEIILVCHSLGGLIARRYLCDCVKRKEPIKIKKLLLLSTPNQGSDLAKIAKWILFFNKIARQLCKNSDFLDDLNIEWDEYLLKCKVKVQYIYGTNDNIVGKESAQHFWESNFRQVLNAGHFDIAKPKNRNADIYRIVKSAIIDENESPDIFEQRCNKIDSISDDIISLIGPGLKQKRWLDINWKTLYTININTKLKTGRKEFNSILNEIRKEGIKTADDFLNQKCEIFKFIDPALGLCSLNENHTYLQNLKKIKNLLSDHNFHEIKKSIKENFKFETIKYIDTEILHRIICIESIIYGLLYKNQISDYIFNIGDSERLFDLFAQLIYFNLLRDMDHCFSKFDDNHFTIKKETSLDYLKGVKRDQFNHPVSYLVRWHNAMNIVMLNDDAKSAASACQEPYPNMPKYQVSYRYFLSNAPNHGFTLSIGNYQDLDVENYEIKAWSLQNDQWIKKNISTNIFYDKFQTNIKTQRLKDKLKNDKHSKVWNTISFNNFITDKYNLYLHLKKNDVPQLSPTHKMNKHTIHKEEIINDIRDSSSEYLFDFDENFECIVVKPLTGYGGKGVKRFTPNQFFNHDFARDKDYQLYDELIVQPFFQSSNPHLLGEKYEKHDIRIYIVGTTPIVGMIRKLPIHSTEWVASLENIEKVGGERIYLDYQELYKNEEIMSLVDLVSQSIYSKGNYPSSIFSIDMMWVKKNNQSQLLVVELNAKPSQIWHPDDLEGEKFMKKFQDAILEEFGSILLYQ
jgi:triacylglycerol esterase/lipase EstA (alpha/beta hydrolase family)